MLQRTLRRLSILRPATRARLVHAVNSHQIPSARFRCFHSGFQSPDVQRLGSSGSGDPTQDQLTLSDSQRRTIYALSTPPGKAGVAVIRLSGPDALDVWRRIIRVSGHSETGASDTIRTPKPWRFYRCFVVHPSTGEPIDDGLAVFFKGPKSFTMEDVLEVHVHSGRAVVSAVLEALSNLPFCRLASPGEFTRRAFTAGRLDLTQVEGLHDLINADTESQRKLALRATSGSLKSWLEDLRTSIVACLGLVEALIDFEGEDIEDTVLEQAREKALRVRSSILNQLSDFRRGEIFRSGARLAIYGPPNAGKSSLFNVLAQREAAIVTDVPGTTRDVLEISLDLAGLPLVVADTAGLRDTMDVVERIGVARATDTVATADISLCVLSLPELLHANKMGKPNLGISPALCSIISREKSYVLVNKTDLILPGFSSDLEDQMQQLQVRKAWMVSLTTGEGVRQFLDEFGGALRARYGMDQASAQDIPLIANARHREHLEASVRFLDAFLTTLDEDVVIAAEELRYAAQAVGMISGRIDVEDILNVIFRDFCIGK